MPTILYSRSASVLTDSATTLGNTNSTSSLDHDLTKPVLPRDPPKRIDYVLACETTQAIDQGKLTGAFKNQTINETRRLFLQNLQIRYHIEYEVFYSTSFRTPLLFYLLHMPFDQLEKQAKRLGIHKRLSDESVQQMEKGLALLDATPTTKKPNLPPRNRTAGQSNKLGGVNLSQEPSTSSQHSLSGDYIKVEDMNWEYVLSEERLSSAAIVKTEEDDHEPIIIEAPPTPFEQFKSIFTINHNQLQKTEQHYSTVYDSDIRTFFHGIYDKSGALNDTTFFTHQERSRILYHLLRECPYSQQEAPDGSDNEVGIEPLFGLVGPVFKAAFPLHAGPIKKVKTTSSRSNMRSLLHTYWGRLRMVWKPQPLEYVNEYFGEKVAMYFSWIHYYKKALVYASIWGILPIMYGYATMHKTPVVTEICQNGTATSKLIMCPLCDNPRSSKVKKQASDTKANGGCDYTQLSWSCHVAQSTWVLDNDLVILLALGLAIWLAYFLTIWRRNRFKLGKNVNLTTADKNKEPPRAPGYRDNVDKHDRLKNQAISVGSLVAAVVLMLIATLSCALYELALVRSMAKSSSFQRRTGVYTQASPQFFASLNASALSVFVMFFLNRIYENVAVLLSNREVYRTALEYQTTIAKRVFWLQFTNYMAPLFYLAFIKNWLQGYPQHYRHITGVRITGCEGGTCTYPLVIQLIMTIAIKQWLVIIPGMIRRIYHTKRLKRRGAIGKYATLWEHEYTLTDNGEMTLFHEYLETVTDYALAILFVCAFPLAPLMVLVGTVFKCRLDAAKFLLHRRQSVNEGHGMAFWEGIMQKLTRMAITTNMLVLTLTTNYVSRFAYRWTHGFSMVGFVKSSLTKFTTSYPCFPYSADLRFHKPDGTSVVARECHLFTRREFIPGDKCTYNLSIAFWIDLCAKLIFFIVLERTIVMLAKFIIRFLPQEGEKRRTEEWHKKRLTRQILKFTADDRISAV